MSDETFRTELIHELEQLLGEARRAQDPDAVTAERVGDWVLSHPRVRLIPAVAAMREPTEAMISAGLDKFAEHFNGHDDGHLIREVWRAMNDAALA